jgi:hypothetical protein
MIYVFTNFDNLAVGVYQDVAIGKKQTCFTHRLRVQFDFKQQKHLKISEKELSVVSCLNSLENHQFANVYCE